MSGSAVKETRREIRKAVGTEVLTAFEELGDRVTRVENDLKFRKDVPYQIGRESAERDLQLKKQLDTLTEAVEGLALARKLELERDMARHRTIFTRLKWLLTGQ